MKKLLFFILLLLIALVVIGCYSMKTSNPAYDGYDVAYDSAYSEPPDEVYDGEPVGSAPPDEVYEDEPVGSAPPDEVVSGSVPPESEPIESGVQVPIFAPKDVVIQSIETGTIAFSIPDTMTYGNVETITLRITKNETVEVVTRGIAQPDRVLIIENVRVSPLMTAELIDPSPDKACFVIKGINTTEQNIEEQGYTQWEWTVKPVKAGSHPLKLLIKVKTQTGTKDIPVYDQNIYVYAKPVAVVEEFFSKYWQWLFTTFLIPIFIYFWKRKKKGQEPEE